MSPARSGQVRFDSQILQVRSSSVHIFDRSGPAQNFYRSSTVRQAFANGIFSPFRTVTTFTYLWKYSTVIFFVRGIFQTHNFKVTFRPTLLTSNESRKTQDGKNSDERAFHTKWRSIKNQRNWKITIKATKIIKHNTSRHQSGDMATWCFFSLFW